MIYGHCNGVEVLSVTWYHQFKDKMATSEKKYKLKKLQKTKNFKQWSRNMTFALQEAKLWKHISRKTMQPPELKFWSDNDEDQ